MRTTRLPVAIVFVALGFLSRPARAQHATSDALERHAAETVGSIRFPAYLTTTQLKTSNPHFRIEVTKPSGDPLFEVSITYGNDSYGSGEKSLPPSGPTVLSWRSSASAGSVVDSTGPQDSPWYSTGLHFVLTTALSGNQLRSLCDPGAKLKVDSVDETFSLGPARHRVIALLRAAGRW